MRRQRVYSVREMRNWPHFLDNSWFPMRPRHCPNASSILQNQVQDLVPVKGVEVRVLSSAVSGTRGYGDWPWPLFLRSLAEWIALRDDTHAHSSRQRGGSRRRQSQSTRRGQARSASAIPPTGTSTAPVRWNLSASPLICPFSRRPVFAGEGDRDVVLELTVCHVEVPPRSPGPGVRIGPDKSP